jgi:penicillin-binding protein 1A
MRSSYWGQGGHNAILLVGDFFRSALDAGKLDPAALFPGGQPPTAPRSRQDEPEEEFIEPGDMVEGMPPDQPPPQPEEPEEDEAEEVIDAPMEGVPPPPPPPPPQSMQLN